MAPGTADASEAAVEAAAVQEVEHALPHHGAKRPRAGFVAIGVSPLVVLEIPLERSVENRPLRMPRTVDRCSAVPSGRRPRTRSGRERPHMRRPLGGGGWSHRVCARLQIRLATPTESRLVTCLARLASSPCICLHPVAVERSAGHTVTEAPKPQESLRERAIRCKGAHRAARRSGAPDRIRTDDIQLGKLTLYRLTY